MGKINQEQFILAYSDAICRKLTIREFADEIGMDYRAVLMRRKDYKRRDNLEFPKFVDERSPVTVNNIAKWQKILNDAELKKYDS
jgi:hypothetical protein